MNPSATRCSVRSISIYFNSVGHNLYVHLGCSQYHWFIPGVLIFPASAYLEQSEDKSVFPRDSGTQSTCFSTLGKCIATSCLNVIFLLMSSSIPTPDSSSPYQTMKRAHRYLYAMNLVRDKLLSC